MRIFTSKITEKTAGHCDIIDIAPRIHAAIEKDHHGLRSALVSGSSAALTTTEHEWAINSPPGHGFWPVHRHTYRKVSLGTSQQVILLFFHNRPRMCEITLELIGETE